MLHESEANKYSPSLIERFPELKEANLEQLPKHTLIIPDGNVRFAKKIQGVTALPIIGHRAGAYKVQEILRKVRGLPIEIVTIWAFSDNNWKRDEKEISDLMQLFDRMVKSSLSELMQSNVRFVHLGGKKKIPEYLAETLNNAEEKTKKHNGQILCLAIDFGRADQECRMFERYNELPEKRKTPVTPELIESLRDGGGLIPPADLIIRTKERRLSGLGWIGDGTRTELYVIDKFFPEIETSDILEAIVYFSKKQINEGGRPNEKKSEVIIMQNNLLRQG